MKIIKIIFLAILVVTLTNCSSSYKAINPESVNYISYSEVDGVMFEYKYNVLKKKYGRKERRKGVKLLSIKVTNNSDRDLIFGEDITLCYNDGSSIPLMERKKTYKLLKQKPATFLPYLLLTPLFYQAKNQVIPIGLFLGAGITAGNMIRSGAANRKFKSELFSNDLDGELIKKGETKYGFIAIKSYSYESITLKVRK